MEITEQLYGAAHPLAVRSREDCIIILRDNLPGHEEVCTVRVRIAIASPLAYFQSFYNMLIAV